MKTNKNKIMLNGTVIETDNLSVVGDVIYEFELGTGELELTFFEKKLLKLNEKLKQLNLKCLVDSKSLLKDTTKLIEVNGELEYLIKFIFCLSKNELKRYVFYTGLKEKNFSREISLIGSRAFSKLSDSSVMVVGLGGVGSSVCEALARAGIGKIIICDFDIVSPSNINRQIIALNSNVGEKKTHIMKKRIKDINPLCIVEIIDQMIKKENVSIITKYSPDYIVDAIDMIDSKIFLINCAKINNLPIISSMGTGNKINPLDFRVSDIYNTQNCPLARKLRKELRSLGVSDLKVVYSEEKNCPKHRVRGAVGSISFVPPVAGYVLASEVIKDLIQGL